MLNGKKPWALLMNINFDTMTYANVEQYFQLCLFYGFLPSFFSPNGSILSLSSRHSKIYYLLFAYP